MRVRTTALIILLGLLVSPTFANNDKEGRGSSEQHKKEKKHRYENGKNEEREYTREREHEREKEHKSKPLNRGMQKKVDRGGTLPYGWEKKVVKGETLDKEVYAHGKVVEPLNVRGEITIEVDERLIRLHQATMEIIDVFKSTRQKD